MIFIDGVKIDTVLMGVEWEGSKDQSPRTLKFSFLYYPKLKGEPVDIPKYEVTVGAKVEWIENNKILFLGYVTKLEYTSETEKIEVSCLDLSARLANSKCIGRFQGTLKQIADNICNTFGLKNGIEADSTHVHNIVSTGDKSYYEILYTAGETVFGRDKFNFYMDGNILKLAEKVVQNTFAIKKNIRVSKFTFDVENLTTRVLVLNDNGLVVDSKSNQSLINKYGIFQKVYNWDKDCQDNYAQIEELLKEPEKKCYIVCDNDNNCISGRYIQIYEPLNDYIGVFEIISDSHTINADSEMTLYIKEVTEDV